MVGFLVLKLVEFWGTDWKYILTVSSSYSVWQIPYCLRTISGHFCKLCPSMNFYELFFMYEYIYFREEYQRYKGYLCTNKSVFAFQNHFFN